MIDLFMAATLSFSQKLQGDDISWHTLQWTWGTFPLGSRGWTLQDWASCNSGGGQRKTFPRDRCGLSNFSPPCHRCIPLWCFRCFFWTSTLLGSGRLYWIFSNLRASPYNKTSLHPWRRMLCFSQAHVQRYGYTHNRHLWRSRAGVLPLNPPVVVSLANESCYLDVLYWGFGSQYGLHFPFCGTTALTSQFGYKTFMNTTWRSDLCPRQ